MSIGVYRVTIITMYRERARNLRSYIKTIATLKNAESTYGQELQALAHIELDMIRAMRDSLEQNKSKFVDTKNPKDSEARYKRLLMQMTATIREFTDSPSQKLTLLLDAKLAVPPARMKDLPQDARLIGVIGRDLGAVFSSAKNGERIVLNLQP